ncbi:MraY family glycosyltransferase [Phycicoccus sp. Soil748]|uniref:MraY family glycosyltransferase n=1 Tax=Phycicoccus sp. Soil748 TaxID=1736397 RepID=UPI00070342CC|nr:MraY family glycosyltransferase [Phycicoccus sp. Soil748]KRE55101.1 UDP-N-acetylmuramyl pentapeptide phosphotransferase [Phycicoccus sp. Soil748]
MREYLLVLMVAAVITYAATPLMRAVAVRTGAFTPVRDRDVHSTPIPRLGGVAIFLGFAASMLAASRLPFLGQVFRLGPELNAVLWGAAIVCLLGAIDDIRELDWLTKMGGQMIAAGIMAFNGVTLFQLPIGGVTVLPQPIMVGLTVFAVVLFTNAVNFIDGLDGLAAGVVIVAASSFFIYSYGISRTFDPPNVFSSATFISAALIGCCLGFLPHNYHPARLFMGDSGALLLGLLLAAATISTTGNVTPSQVSTNPVAATLLPLVVPAAIILLPLVDILLAVVRRTRRGERPWSPDKQHLHHRMLQIGHGHRRAVLLLWMWAAVAALGSVSFIFIQDARVAGAGVLAAVVVVGVLTIWLPRWAPTGGRVRRIS